MKKKCRHDKCHNKKEPKTNHGYCDQCIQIPSQRCNRCNMKEVKKESKSISTAKILIFVIAFSAIIGYNIVKGSFQQAIGWIIGWSAGWTGGWFISKALAKWINERKNKR